MRLLPLAAAALLVGCTPLPEPQFDVDGCGEGAAMPVVFLVPGEPDPLELWPGMAVGSPARKVALYSGWEVFDVLCDDFDSPGYSWSWRAFFDVDGDGTPG